LSGIPVVAAVAHMEKKFLICCRPIHKHHGGNWEFPGGKCEAGESPSDALSRELLEELELKVIDVGECLFSGSEPESPFIISFYPVTVVGEVVLHEHTDYRWCSLEEMSGVNLAPVDWLFVKEFLGKEKT